MTKTENKAKSYESSPLLMSYTEASRFLGLPIGTLYSMVSHKRIPHIRFSSRGVRFRMTELMSWLDANSIAIAHGSKDPLKQDVYNA